MRFLCTNCGHIYDEALGDLSEGIGPGTNIDMLVNEDIHCPACDGSFDDYSPIEDEVLYAEKADRKNELEKEHIPYIVYRDHEKIEVQVGEEMHATDDEDRITAVYLVDDEGHIVEEVFIMPEEDPVCEFDISGIDLFELRASCSRHGLWSTGLIESL